MADNATQELMGDILDTANPVQPNAPALVQANAAALGTTPPPATLPEFPGFDPEVHAVKDGKPIALADGSGWQRKRGRPRGTDGKFSTDPVTPETPGPTSVAAESPVAAAGEAVSMAQAKVAAAQLCTVGMTLAQAVFGEEWAPEVYPMGETPIDEFEVTTNALADYLYAEQLANLSPGWVALIAVGQYAGRRVQRPKTKAKIFGWMGMVRGWIFGRK